MKNKKNTTRINVGLIIKTVALATLVLGASLLLASIKPIILGAVVALAVYAIKQ